MTLQTIINTASKYPWRYGWGSFHNDPIKKMTGAHSIEGAAEVLSVEARLVQAFVTWWDETIDREDVNAAFQATKLIAAGYTIPAGPRLIRARRKTKRVRAYQYLRSL